MPKYDGMDIRELFGLVVFWLGGFLFAGALVALPYFSLDHRKVFIGLICGAVALALLRGEMRLRFLGAFISLAGAVGLIQIIFGWIGSRVGSSKFATHNLSLAIPYHLVLLAAGLTLIRRSNRAASHTRRIHSE